jgi:hypothetical protein
MKEAKYYQHFPRQHNYEVSLIDIMLLKAVLFIKYKK